ncbi:hypothetical protein H0E84_10720 [Luteimonas sp. SJ-92]|uniref:DUF1311 domain-containing protein n=1 Tax=Luteimonas salinisoli TaxID=2752307 RepID=A0A853JEC5_9GAMM|nr:hypothetical protein [Luteimonas salinisoli]NZA26858.1 hypothetical protein [Luteimonas salinisoli]
MPQIPSKVIPSKVIPSKVIPSSVILSSVLWCCAAVSTAAAQAPDCDSPGSWAERTICRSAPLRDTDARVQALQRDLLLRSDDPAAVEAEARQWRESGRDACTTVRCLETAYRTRTQALQARLAAGRPLLLLPGEYRRHTAAGPVEGAARLSVELLGQRRYRMRILPADGAAEPLAEGEFAEQVGSGEFEAGACTLRMRFAPDLVSVSGAAPGCGADLDGSYLRAPAEP